MLERLFRGSCHENVSERNRRRDRFGVRRKDLGTTLPVAAADASSLDLKSIDHRYGCVGRFGATCPAFTVHRQFDSGPWLQGGEFRVGDPHGRSDQ